MTLRSKDVNAGEGEQGESVNRSDHNRQFYDEYKKIFTTGYCLSQQLKQLVDSRADLWNKLLAYEKKAEEEFKDKMRKEAPEKKKRNRRCNEDMEKKFACLIKPCDREYGTEGSLTQHMKLKHADKYKEMLASGQLKRDQSDSVPHSSSS